MSFIDKLKKNVQDDELKIRRALKSVDEKYHQFIVIIEQNSVVSNRELQIDEKLEELGCFVWQGKTYQRRRAPYMAVDGRIMMMRDEHRKEGAKYSFSQEIDWEHNLLTIYWESELYGRTIGTAKIGIGGSGADATNPVENAQTSAVGRALAQAGYGLFGTGSIASAEEVQSAIREREQMEEQAYQAQATQMQAPQVKPAPAHQTPPQQKVQPQVAQPQTAQPEPQAQKVQQAPQATPKAQPQPQPNGSQFQNVPLYSPEQVRRLINIKQRMGIVHNTDLDKYVAEFGKATGAEGLARHTQLVGPLLEQFCDYMEKRLEEQGAA